MLYAPVYAEDGKVWLNNNLGAHYTNINHTSFNPSKQAEPGPGATDHLAYGSLFQWGRKPDGHELINYYSGQHGVAVYGTTYTKSNSPTNNLFVRGSVDWRTTQDDSLWSSVSSSNNPCPQGFKVPSNTELNAWVGSAGISDPHVASLSMLKLTIPGYRHNDDGLIEMIGGFGHYWTSTTTSTNANYLHLSSGFKSFYDGDRAVGRSVRCIKY
jgi:hypothetical protein